MALIIGVRNFSVIGLKGRIILTFVLISFLIDVISRAYVNLFGSNLILFNILSLVELLAFCLFFYSSEVPKKIATSVFILGGLFVLVESWLNYSERWQTFQGYSKAFVAFLIVCLALFSILNQIIQEREVENKPMNYGVIFYFSMEFILLLPMNYLINARSEYVMFLWATRIGVIFIFYFIIIHYLWSLGRTQKLLPSG